MLSIKKSVHDYRPIIVETGVLAVTNGSARVRLASTDLLIAVKAELCSTADADNFSNRINFTVDLTANATPLFEGRGGEEKGEEIASALHSAYNNDFVLPDLKKLILSPKHAWKLYVDIVVLQYGGNVMDAATIGVKAALFDTEICDVILRAGDEGKVVIDLPEFYTTWRLNVSRLPLFACISKLGTSSVVDTSLEEQACSRSQLWVAVASMADSMQDCCVCDDYKIVMMRQCGGGAFQIDTLNEIIQLGVETGMRLQRGLARRLLNEESDDTEPLLTFLSS